MTSQTETLAVQLGELLLSQRLTVTCAESCTGGGIASAITDVPGSSQWFHMGFVTYADQSKHQLLGVPPQVIATEGAVSESVVKLMAKGALDKSEADIAVAVSGIAGPGGGTTEKPVGPGWFCWATASGAVEAQSLQFQGDRATVRSTAIDCALKGLISLLQKT
jgi:nicotinamide-nucleotide amidase